MSFKYILHRNINLTVKHSDPAAGKNDFIDTVLDSMPKNIQCSIDGSLFVIFLGLSNVIPVIN
jgi:hypothetical protein